MSTPEEFEVGIDTELLPTAVLNDEELTEKFERVKTLTGWAARTLGKAAVVGVFSAAATAGLMQAAPYHGKAGDIPFTAKGTLFTRPGISADTAVGSWEFPNVDGLPVGVHVSPEDVNVLTMARNASPNTRAYVEKLQVDFQSQAPKIERWLGGEVAAGVLAGLLLTAFSEWSIAHLRNRSKREDEWQHQGKRALATVATLGVLAGYGAATYNPDWAKESRLTGTLAAAQGVRHDLASFYGPDTKSYGVLQGILAIQSGLQEKIGEKQPATAFNIMFVSDMHLANTYDLVAQYAEEFGVKLIVNTGDESEFGTRAEMTPEYLDSLKDLTKKVPMLWIAGNHDSPETVSIMRKIPGVTVLGTKERNHEKSSYDVTAQFVEAYGLTIGGLPDPRVYGGNDEYGSNDPSVTHALETKAVNEALKNSVDSTYFDIFAVHEPVAATEVVKQLGPKHLRQVNFGHRHMQNPSKDIQKDKVITLEEGSTGGGGLDHIDTHASPVQFTIASIAPNCQETKLLRYSLSPSISGIGNARDYNGGVTTVDTIYLRTQNIEAGRSCATDLGIGTVQDLVPVNGQTARAQAQSGKQR